MSDSYGDGWNGAEWHGFVQMFTIDSGGSGSGIFELPIDPPPSPALPSKLNGPNARARALNESAGGSVWDSQSPDNFGGVADVQFTGDSDGVERVLQWFASFSLW
eukprot:CAMPEP_0119347718 /NCGR_PEP_ID=MMETSP1333-20130426/108671_1 /TAXON_ID=418940 /ORGANISM="Scyphosphaera apsteinii, Strain RCC1455" /LENGTH=104 /DNA_ID=CAMNT_0007360275 /DNA_START=389 /DNA_END=700 /DNA_ORIENTATION=-